MFTKLVTILVAGVLSLVLAGNALATFQDLELIRVVYERTTGTTEQLTDLGAISSFVGSNKTIAGDVISANNANNLFVGYFALDRTTKEVWATSGNASAPVMTGGVAFNTLTNGSGVMYVYYNATTGTHPTVDANGVFTGTQSFASSYKSKLSASQGRLGSALNGTSTIESSLASLVGNTGAVPVVQILYHFSDASISGSVGVPVATIKTNADGSSTILQVTSDATPPTVSAFTVSSPTSSNRYSINGITLDATDNSGVVAGYLISESATPPLVSTPGWTSTPPTSYTISTPPPYGVLTKIILYAWAKDLNGNISPVPLSTSVDVTAIDTTPPIVTTFTIPATSVSATITGITFTATDDSGTVGGYLLNDTGVQPLANDSGWTLTAPTSYSFTNIPVGVKTSKGLFAWVKDAAGNIGGASASVDITIPGGDTTPPVVTITTPPTFTSATFGITFTATDAVGVTGYLVTETATPPLAGDSNWVSVTPAATSFSTNVTHTFNAVDPGPSSIKALYVWAKDAAGNVSNADPTATVQITILKPAKLTGAVLPPDPYFLLLQDAINAAADGDTIQTMINIFNETILNVNRPSVRVTVKGGFDTGFGSNGAGASTLHGQLLISNGTVTAENLVIN